MIEYNNIMWNNYHGALIPRVAPHTEISLTDKQANELLSKSNAYLIRYTNEWDRGDGEFWYLIKDNFGGLEELKTKYRTQIRKGLKNCIVTRVRKEKIAENGYEVYKSAFDNYTTILTPMAEDVFKSGILHSDYDHWAVYTKEGNRLIAYSQVTIIDNICKTTVAKFDPAYLRLRPSEALFYTINRYYLAEKNFLYVNNGARSISHDTNIQHFLEQKLNFRKSYCKLNIYYRKDIRLIVNTLYPFRYLIWRTKGNILSKLSAILKQENIRRSSN